MKLLPLKLSQHLEILQPQFWRKFGEISMYDIWKYPRPVKTQRGMIPTPHNFSGDGISIVCIMNVSHHLCVIYMQYVCTNVNGYDFKLILLQVPNERFPGLKISC